MTPVYWLLVFYVGIAIASSGDLSRRIGLINSLRTLLYRSPDEIKIKPGLVQVRSGVAKSRHKRKNQTKPKQREVDDNEEEEEEEEEGSDENQRYEETESDEPDARRMDGFNPSPFNTPGEIEKYLNSLEPKKKKHRRRLRRLRKPKRKRKQKVKKVKNVKQDAGDSTDDDADALVRIEVPGLRNNRLNELLPSLSFGIGRRTMAPVVHVAKGLTGVASGVTGVASGVTDALRGVEEFEGQMLPFGKVNMQISSQLPQAMNTNLLKINANMKKSVSANMQKKFRGNIRKTNRCRRTKKKIVKRKRKKKSKKRTNRQKTFRPAREMVEDVIEDEVSGEVDMDDEDQMYPGKAIIRRSSHLQDPNHTGTRRSAKERREKKREISDSNRYEDEEVAEPLNAAERMSSDSTNSNNEDQDAGDLEEPTRRSSSQQTPDNGDQGGEPALTNEITEARRSGENSIPPTRRNGMKKSKKNDDNRRCTCTIRNQPIVNHPHVVHPVPYPHPVHPVVHPHPVAHPVAHMGLVG